MFSINNLKNFMKAFFLVFFILLFIYIIVNQSERISEYIESANDLLNVLDSGQNLNYLMGVQSDSIYPLYDLIIKFRNFDFLPIFIGSGLGTASVINNLYAEVIFGTSNPNSQLVRLLYESGLIGTVLFVFAFIVPIKKILRKFDYKTQNKFIFYS